MSTNLSMQVYCQILPSKRTIGIMAAMKPLGRLVTFGSPSLPPCNVLTFWPRHRVDLRKEIVHTDTHSWGVVETKPCKIHDAGCCVDSVWNLTSKNRQKYFKNKFQIHYECVEGQPQRNISLLSYKLYSCRVRLWQLIRMKYDIFLRVILLDLMVLLME